MSLLTGSSAALRAQQQTEGLEKTAPYVKRWGQTSAKRRGSSAGSYGDIHYYNYDADCEDPATYPLARFVSEHGFQAFPSFDVYKTVTAARDWSRESTVVSHRMRHPNGDAQAVNMMRLHFRVPDANASADGSAAAASRQRQLFDDYLWLTQLQQARCYETAFSVWRRLRSAPANTMGILYWQLNAIWQGPDWASIEYDGRLRLSHHFTRRVFADVLVSTTTEDIRGGPGDGGSAGRNHQRLRVHVSNDHPTAAVSGTLTLRLHRWADATPLAVVETSVEVGPAQTKSVWVGDRLLGKGGTVAPEEAFVQIQLRGHRVADEQGQQMPITASAEHWLSQMKDAALPKAIVSVLGVTKTAVRTAQVRVKSDQTAAFVTLESPEIVGAFSDGGFLLLAGVERTLDFEARSDFATGIDGFELLPGLRARSLRDTYA